MRWCLLTLSLVVLAGVPVHAAAPPRGYQPRACGFDLNHNGITGEPADCTICSTSDGNLTVDSSTYTQVYVDCQNGNNANAGTRASPKKTITSALTVTPTSGASLAVCFTGSCSPSSGETFPLVPKGGLTGNYSRSTSPSEPAPFQFPTKPAMLVGWDTNGNGQYPPNDAADKRLLNTTAAVLDGENTAIRAIENLNLVSNFELAHFTAQNFGIPVQDESGFMRMSFSGGAPISYIALHDLQLTNILKGRQSLGNSIVFNFFNSVPQYVSLINLNVTDWGSIFVRGAPGTSGPIRFQNITARASGSQQVPEAGGNIVFAFKLWGEVTGIDILDSMWDANPRAWKPCVGGAAPDGSGNGCLPTYAITACQCSRNWTVRNNTFLDWKSAFNVQPDAGPSFCQTRSMDGIVFDRNTVRNTYAPWFWGDEQISLESGSSATTTIENATISNNFISNTDAGDACIYSHAGNNGASQVGTINIVGNTCAMDIGRFGAIIVGALNTTDSSFPQQNYIIKDNIVTGLGAGDTAMCIQYAPSGLQLDGNVYNRSASDAAFVWGSFGARNCTGDGGNVNFTTWKDAAHSNKDALSKLCAPSFVSSSTGDFHLNELTAPYCARDAGVPLTGITSTDIDGDTRPQGTAWDIGADEYVTSTGVLGDLDGNTVVDILDLQRMVNVLLGLETDPAVIVRADLDGQNGATVLDLQLLVNKLLGL